MITYLDRKKYCALIEEAIENGAKQHLACELHTSCTGYKLI